MPLPLVVALLFGASVAVTESPSERRPLLLRCVDPNCTGSASGSCGRHVLMTVSLAAPVSTGKTMANYLRSGEELLSFTADLDVLIFGKPADPLMPLAYAEVGSSFSLLLLTPRLFLCCRSTRRGDWCPST